MDNLTEKELLELAREKRNEYAREWHNREENKDKRKEYARRHWIKKAIEELESQKQA